MNSLPHAGLHHITLASALAFSASLPASAQETLALYTTRKPGLIQPLLGSWTKISGIKASTVYIKDGMLEHAKAGGKNSPADLLMTVDAGDLIDLVETGVTQPVRSEALETAIPANLYDADNQWLALSMRTRMLYAEESLSIDNWHYEQLASPEYKGKVCTRSGQHPYNTALVAVIIAYHSEVETEEQLCDMKTNLARKATGGDRDVAHGILGGICDIGLTSSHCIDHMKNAKGGGDARQWGNTIKVVKPTFESGGTHVNISDVAVARYAPNKADAVKLMEYLISTPTQQQYTKANFEYSVLRGVTLDPVISATIDGIDVDKTPLTKIVKYRKQVSLLVDEVRSGQ